MSKDYKQNDKEKEFIIHFMNQMEFDFLSSVYPDDLITREKQIPITDKTRIKALIYNLLKSDVLSSQLNYKRYSMIMDIYIDRLTNSSSLDLKDMEKKLDDALAKETKESLTEWMEPRILPGQAYYLDRDGRVTGDFSKAVRGCYNTSSEPITVTEINRLNKIR